MLGWILEAVNEAEWDPTHFWVDEHYPRTMMLTLVVYAYHKEFLTAGEIEKAVETDEVLRYVCCSRQPSAEVIRRFRRGHIEVIRVALATVLERALASDGPGEETPGDGLRSYAAFELADQRIRSAMLMEMIALDV